MVEVIPAILTASPDELATMLETYEGKVNRVQIDIIDGQFADNKTVEPTALESIDTSLLLDFHLMTKEPINWVEKCVRGGADRIIGQIEMMESQHDFVGKVQEVGAYVGLAIDLDTDLSKLDPTMLNNLDVVLAMSVKAGFGGQEFDDKVIDKIKKLDEIRLRDQTPFKIIVDGGVGEENIESLRKIGVDEVAIGKSIFKGDIGDNIEKLTKNYTDEK